nr:DNA-binding protein [uncultured Acetatifactor sp.]
MSIRQTNYFCTENRIPGAVKMAGVWLLPKAVFEPREERDKKREGDNQ